MTVEHRLAPWSLRVPVVLQHNPELELNVVEYHGAVTLAELKAQAAFMAQNPEYLRFDTLSLVLEGADFDSVDLRALDAIFARYATMYAPLSFQIMRRSAWLCLSPQARPHVDHWLKGRETRESMSSAVRQFGTFPEAGDWLVLSAEDTATLERRDGFNTVTRFDIPAGYSQERAL